MSNIDRILACDAVADAAAQAVRQYQMAGRYTAPHVTV